MIHKKTLRGPLRVFFFLRLIDFSLGVRYDRKGRARIRPVVLQQTSEHAGLVRVAAAQGVGAVTSAVGFWCKTMGAVPVT